jgi:hypothetical protein
MGISFKLFNELVPFVTDARKPVLLRSRHGVGKSMVVYQYAKSIGLPVVERRASQMSEGDLLGLPKMKGDSTQWQIPDWLKLACDNAVVLFVDEIDRATPEVRQGFFELTDSRKIAGWNLHPDTLIFAAINGGEHASQYQVGEMDPAESDRWTTFDLEPTTEDWLTWATDVCHPMVVTFIRENHKHLEHAQGEFEPGKIYPSRRSWHRLSEALQIAEKKNKVLCDAGAPSPLLSHLVNAFCGLEASVAFMDYVKNQEKMLSAADIVKLGLIDKTKAFNIADHTNMIEKIKDAKYFQKPLKEKEMKNLVAYWLTLPSEVAMKMFQDIAKEFEPSKDKPEMANVVKFHGMPGVKEKFASMLGDPNLVKKLSEEKK